MCEYALGVFFFVTCHLRCCAALGGVLFRQEAICPLSLPHSCHGNQLKGDLGCILLAKLYLSDDICFDSKHCIADQILNIIRKGFFCLAVRDSVWGSLRYV